MPFLNRSSSAGIRALGKSAATAGGERGAEEGGAGTIRAGGGRMTFGFGEEKKEEEKEDDDEEEEAGEGDDSDGEMQVKVGSDFRYGEES